MNKRQKNYKRHLTRRNVFFALWVAWLMISTPGYAQLFGGQIKTGKVGYAGIIPSTITLGQNQKYFVASVYDTNYLPYTAPTSAATTATGVNPDGTAEAVTVNVQGTITTSGVTVTIPVTATGSGTLPAYSTTINIPASLAEDGISRDITLSWGSQAYTNTTTSITATIAAVGGTLYAKKLDINAGIGNDYLGYLMGQFIYPYNNAGATTYYQVRDIPGIPDKMFGKTDNAGVLEHNFLYLPVQGEDGNIWLNNNLGADYANVNNGSFAPGQQATANDDSHAYGSLFQWGRKPDGHELINWTTGLPVYNSISSTAADIPADTKFIILSEWRVTYDDALWATEASANNPCPGGFRVPTSAEQTALITAAGITNYTNAAASKLKFPVPGYRYYGSGSFNSAGGYGYYWSSTASAPYVRVRYFTSGSTDMSYGGRRGSGFSVRCIKN